MVSKKKWLDKYASPEGAVRVVGTHRITDQDIQKHERWKKRISQKFKP